MPAKFTNNEFIKRAKEKHSNKYDYSQLRLGKIFDVSQTTIGAITRNKTWRTNCEQS